MPNSVAACRQALALRQGGIVENFRNSLFLTGNPKFFQDLGKATGKTESPQGILKSRKENRKA
jgi:hypothetical protein